MIRRTYAFLLFSALGCVLLAVAVSACGGTAKGGTSSAAASTLSVSPSSLGGLQQTYVSVIDRVALEVVQISTAEGLGSGVIFDKQGDIVTNAHVVAGSGALTVTDSRGHSYPAALVGRFIPDDLAVVHAPGMDGKAGATFADSGSLKVGDIVLAIGNPLGLRSSVTDGIISALGRTVTEPNGAVLPNTIQTSAAINPGNSGGALVDLEGKVVGIPTLAATDPQLGGAASGIGFAIPTTLVSDIATQIVEHGHVVNSHRAYLGVQLATGPVTGGAVVVGVQQGGPAALAGILAGEEITSLAGKAVGSAGELADALATLETRTAVAVGLTKADGTHSEVKVKLAEYPGS